MKNLIITMLSLILTFLFLSCVTKKHNPFTYDNTLTHEKVLKHDKEKK